MVDAADQPQTDDPVEPADQSRVDLAAPTRCISADINGFAAAPFLILVMLISSNRAQMGEASTGRHPSAG